ncbi:unnamed protein product [Diabrotica balteata]|uniref:Succinate dehydrogenase [ubiquinone] cytochrome b small subunit n=1 Tax=Diabrotica balteata TaxID=107213 RepID=A0A9N9SLD6_DIABA|nr:unnamed protein product [Diabrotica balteata]
MALAAILRRSSRNAVFSNLLKTASVKTEPQKYFVQFTKSTQPTQLFQASCMKPSFYDFSKRHMSGHHAKIWPFEKLVTLSLVGLVPATFIMPNPILDDIFAGVMCLHMHWGLEGCLTDYVRPIILGPLIPKLALLLLYIVTLSTLASLLNYNHNDIGIGATFQKFWQMEIGE